MATLSQTEKDAIRQYALDHGRFWKSQLIEDWSNGKTSGDLQRVRNIAGPSVLKSFKVER